MWIQAVPAVLDDVHFGRSDVLIIAEKMLGEGSGEGFHGVQVVGGGEGVHGVLHGVRRHYHAVVTREITLFKGPLQADVDGEVGKLVAVRMAMDLGHPHAALAIVHVL